MPRNAPHALTPPQPDRIGFPAGLRPARLGDEDALYDHLIAAHADNGLAPLDPTKIRPMLCRATRERLAVIAIAPGPERIEASVCLDACPEWYSDAWQYWERWLFVHPAHRRAGHARRLLQFIQWWAQESGSPVVFGVGSSTRMAAKNRLYARYGRAIGAMFVAGPMHVAHAQEIAA